MPLFDLKCEECSAGFEELVLGDEMPACPECGSRKVRRLYSQISPPARIGLRGLAAKRSDATRREREVARQERKANRSKES